MTAGPPPAPRRYTLRAEPEDFRVEEVPLFPPSGEGGHTFVQVEKRDLDTDEVARRLARAAGVAPREVGYAGRKDRRAVAIQWFSVPGLAPDAARALDAPGLRILDAVPHGHKLRTGALRGNRFRLVVRDVAPQAREGAAARLDELLRRGLPNRFGTQRFGRHGDNAARGRALLRGEAEVRDRRAARFLLSALQAEAFNEVLARRPWPLDAVARGDVAVVQRSGGLFLVEDVEREGPRARAFEISATGPLPGTRMRRAEGEPGALEAEVLRAVGWPEGDLRAPRGIRLRGARRPLRVPLEDASCELSGNCVNLAFALPAGSFATVLVEELLGPT